MPTQIDKNPKGNDFGSASLVVSFIEVILALGIGVHRGGLRAKVTIRDFSQELVDQVQVIDELHPLRGSLKACSLTHRS